MFTLRKVRSQVYHLSFDSSRELAMTFVRYTEFYESKYDHIRECQFTLVQQMSAYCQEHLKNKDAGWTYCSDWSGFNIPVSVISDVHELGILDPNHYDSFMKGIQEMIDCDTLGMPAYLIGTATTAAIETLRHELTHAMYYVDKEYRRYVIRAISSASSGLLFQLGQCLFSANYPSKVHADEINAYIATGEGCLFENVPERFAKELESLRTELIKLHEDYYEAFYGH